MAKVALIKGVGHAFDAILWEGWLPTIVFIFIAPLLGLLLAYIIMISIYWLFQDSSPVKMDNYFRRLQLLSAAIFSYSHGASDAMKTAGIITGVLVTAGYLSDFRVPAWVIFAAHAAIALGTLSGGWRIIHTMGSRLTRLKPRGGFSAETAAAISILFPTHLGVPVSTTHVIAGAIAGVGSINRLKAVRWGLAANIVWAWILTIPAAATVGAIAMLFVRALVHDI
jgi:PiT family inorganic phosphate transporter